MKYNQRAMQLAQRKAVSMLAEGTVDPNNPTKDNGEPNYTIDPVPDYNISGPSVIRQELPYVVTNNIMTFDLSRNGAAATPVLNNIRLSDNDTFCFYAIQILLGQGANRNNRVYRSTGLTPDDNSLYNGNLSLTQESNTPINNVDMLEFFEQGDFINGSGIVMINPLRVVTGSISILDVNINVGNISALTLTQDLFVRVSLIGALGRA